MHFFRDVHGQYPITAQVLAKRTAVARMLWKCFSFASSPQGVSVYVRDRRQVVGREFVSLNYAQSLAEARLRPEGRPSFD